MNMKKSIAGVMAGAMAVSAMAATVSADQDAISLTYDLKKYVVDVDATSKVVVVANYAGSITNMPYTISDVVETELATDGKSYITFGLDNDIVCRSVKNCYKDFPDNGNAIGGMSDFQITAAPLKNLDTGENGAPQTVTWTGDKTKTDGSHFNPDLEDSKHAAVFNMPVARGQISGNFNIANYDLSSLGYSNSSKVYGFQSVTAKMTYKVPVQIIVDGSNAWDWNAANALHAIGETAFVEKVVDAETFINHGNTMVDATHEIEQAPTSVAISAFTAGDAADKIYPMKSSLNKPASVVNSLSCRKAGGNYYTKPVAVINDAIANHENVTFTFTSFGGYVATAKSHLFQEWVEADRAYGWATSSFDWYNPTFGQHLYTNAGGWTWDEIHQAYVGEKDKDDTYSLFGSDDYDMYGSYSSAWGQNLFTGAIVVNSGITMQLNDTDKFDWGNNTLTFDWFTITDEGKITDAKTFLTSMLLYTPTDWYWDNLTVVVADLEDDSVDAGEGLEGDGEELEDEEEVVEEVVEEVTEAPVVEEVPAPAPSPATGNASVALAVIPVALAAAAVVAKKRG